MNKLFTPTLARTAAIFYGSGIAVIGFQNIFFGRFQDIILQGLPLWIPFPCVLAYVAGAALIASGLAICVGKNARPIALALGTFLLVLFIFWQVPYMCFVNPYMKYLGAWTNTLKELALAGGAFAVAGSFTDTSYKKPARFSILEKIIPSDGVFFSVTMIAFGIDHFLYADVVKAMVPSWIPGHLFWTYVAGVALIGSGIGIILKVRLIAFLTGMMIFLWVILLHLPFSIGNPLGGYGNEVTSTAVALAFSGTAFIFAYNWTNEK